MKIAEPYQIASTLSVRVLQENLSEDVCTALHDHIWFLLTSTERDLDIQLFRGHPNKHSICRRITEKIEIEYLNDLESYGTPTSIETRTLISTKMINEIALLSEVPDKILTWGEKFPDGHFTIFRMMAQAGDNFLHVMKARDELEVGLFLLKFRARSPEEMEQLLGDRNKALGQKSFLLSLSGAWEKLTLENATRYANRREDLLRVEIFRAMTSDEYSLPIRAAISMLAYKNDLTQNALNILLRADQIVRSDFDYAMAILGHKAVSGSAKNVRAYSHFGAAGGLK
jgi:hypothetical protein